MRAQAAHSFRARSGSGRGDPSAPRVVCSRGAAAPSSFNLLPHAVARSEWTGTAESAHRDQRRRCSTTVTPSAVIVSPGPLLTHAAPGDDDDALRRGPGGITCVHHAIWGGTGVVLGKLRTLYDAQGRVHTLQHIGHTAGGKMSGK
ncbi:hypothetical protein MRX96_003782 [Rhipicephalus microplus]